MPPAETAERVINNGPHLAGRELWDELVRSVDWQLVIERAAGLCFSNAKHRAAETECASHRDHPAWPRKVCGHSIASVLTARYGEIES